MRKLLRIKIKIFCPVLCAKEYVSVSIDECLSKHTQVYNIPIDDSFNAYSVNVYVCEQYMQLRSNIANA